MQSNTDFSPPYRYYKQFVITGKELLLVQKAMLRLYTENRMSGDEMRDLAQNLRYVIEQAEPLVEE